MVACAVREGGRGGEGGRVGRGGEGRGEDDVEPWAGAGVRERDEAGRLRDGTVMPVSVESFRSPDDPSGGKRAGANGDEGRTMNSTTLMPKCSSTMVDRPTLARPSHASSVG